MRSPFESAGLRVEDVAAVSIAAASTHLNPRNGPAGCGLWRLCRRLGCDSDVFPLLRSAGISGAEALRRGGTFAWIFRCREALPLSPAFLNMMFFARKHPTLAKW